MSRFKKGDILCYRPIKGDWLGNAIAWLSQGNYSHTSCYVGKGEIIESHNEGGVVRKTLNPKWYDSIVVYRYEKLTRTQCNKVMKALEDRIGKGYDLPSFGETWLGILFGWTGMRKHRPKTNDPNKYYCSELVATAYDEAGINITPKVFYMNCTPSDIGHSKVLMKEPFKKVA